MGNYRLCVICIYFFLWFHGSRYPIHWSLVVIHFCMVDVVLCGFHISVPKPVLYGEYIKISCFSFGFNESRYRVPMPLVIGLKFPLLCSAIATFPSNGVVLPSNKALFATTKVFITTNNVTATTIATIDNAVLSFLDLRFFNAISNI